MNKIKIVEAGALEPIITFLESQSSNLQEYAAASLLTLSASAVNKLIIGAKPIPQHTQVTLPSFLKQNQSLL